MMMEEDARSEKQKQTRMKIKQKRELYLGMKLKIKVIVKTKHGESIAQGLASKHGERGNVEKTNVQGCDGGVENSRRVAQAEHGRGLPPRSRISSLITC